MGRRFEAIEGSTRKFWAISVEGARHTVTFGRLGTDGQAKTKDFASAQVATKEAEALIRSKLGKGYVEVGGVKAPVVKATAPAPRLISGPTRAGKRAKVKVKGEIQVPLALPGGFFLAAVMAKNTEVGGTVLVWNAAGKEVATYRFPNASVSGWSRSAAGDVVFVCQETILRFGAAGLISKEKVKGVERATYLASGATVLELAGGKVQLRSAKGKVSTVFQAEGRGLSFWPVVLANDGFALVATTQPRRLLLFDAAGKQTADVALANNGATIPVQAPDGRVVAGSMGVVHLLGPGKKHVKAKLAGNLCTGPLALADGTVVAATKAGTVEFVGPDGKQRACFRREPMGSGETKQDLALLADGTLAAPSRAGTVYRLDAQGKLLGALDLGGELESVTALDDGTLVCADPKGTLHFVGTGDFQAASGDPNALPDLSGEVAKLTAHFAPWAVTPKCQATLAALLARLTKVEREGKAMTLTFLTDEQELYRVEFGPPEKVGSGWPKSYQVVSALHGDICFEDGPPTGILFGQCNAELEKEERKRFTGLCDAGQNWFVFDLKKKNKLGEPGLMLFDHGAAVEDGERFPGQDKEAFGVGGLLLRALGYAVLGKSGDYRGCGWG